MIERAAELHDAPPAGGVDEMSFPFDAPPEPAEVLEVAPGILWARIPLPFRLNHVNVYFIEDGDGWAIVDTGISHPQTRAAWDRLLDGPLAGFRFTRLIVTHHHPDHIGLAGWLCERFGIPLTTSQTCYLGCLNISLNPGGLGAVSYRDFYRRHGMSDETAALVSSLGHAYLGMVSPLPQTFQRLVAGDELVLGNRRFAVSSGDGHAPEQLMLFQPDDGVFLAADQIMTRISPNISVWAVEPNGDPLGLYLRSLEMMLRDLPRDVLVLAGHHLPFHGLHVRARQLVAHHRERCDLIADACRETSLSVAELVPVLFARELDPHQLSFAFSETHAHVNYMIGRGELAWIERSGRLLASGRSAS